MSFSNENNLGKRGRLFSGISMDKGFVFSWKCLGEKSFSAALDHGVSLSMKGQAMKEVVQFEQQL